MRTPLTLAFALAVGLTLYAATPSPGQGRPNYGPGSRPGLSPYLNLLRGGNVAANYYLGVLPEIDRRATQQVFRRQLNTLDREVDRIEDIEDETDPRRSLQGAYGRPLLNSRFGGSTAPTRSSNPGPSRFPPPPRSRRR